VNVISSIHANTLIGKLTLVLSAAVLLLPCCCQVLGAKVKLIALQEALLGLEVDAVEVVAGLVTEFDRCYSEMAEANKLQYNAYFTQVRGQPQT
jgi:hypothetical protein